MSEEGVLLDLVDESEWVLAVRVDEEGDVDLELRSHCFGGWTTTFVPPGQEADDGIERNRWWVIQERVDDEGLPVVCRAEALSVTNLVDKIPTQFEIWVFVVTETQVGRLAAAAEFETPTAVEDVKDGILLRTDLEQAKAHAKTWQRGGHAGGSQRRAWGPAHRRVRTTRHGPGSTTTGQTRALRHSGWGWSAATS